MTTRPGRLALDLLRLTRTKNLCHAIKVTPANIAPLLLTDHDRKLTFEGEVYTPISFGSMSAERREAAFRSGNQEVRGVIDGTAITVPDLDANRYRGAEVKQVVLDWRYPWVVYARHRKWIRSIVRDGSTFIGTLEGRTQAMQRPNGGRFGGTFSATCPYQLGDTATCKKDTSFLHRSVTVQTVVDDRRTAQFDPVHWAGFFIDDYFRDGSLVWTAGANTGVVSPIVGYTHATRECSLLIPTPKPIEVGDTATAKPGCDGLITTCRDKFSNQLNFGGDPYAPSASQIIEPVEGS